MKQSLVLVLLLAFGFQGMAESSTIEKIKAAAVEDWLHEKQADEQDRLNQAKIESTSQLVGLSVGQVMAEMGVPDFAPHNNGCEEEEPNPAQKFCWQKCDADNWNVSYCTKKCGVSSSEGSQACWVKCDQDNWNVDYCSKHCEVKTEAGSVRCWQKCDQDNWNVDYCSKKCGVDTAGGSSACWQKCDDDNWNIDYCSKKCGS